VEGKGQFQGLLKLK